LYLVGPDAVSSVHPIELLSAAVPGGVACYFTAMSFYSLTTQHPPHHHIARVRAASAPASRARSDARVETRATGGTQPAASYDPLGTHLFSHDGLPYYVTARDGRWLPGIKSRFLHSTACVRITSIEQTLIDTLHRPQSCGGPPVIFEAWAASLDEQLADVEEIVRLVLAIGDDRIARRVAYMLDAHDGEVCSELRRIVETVRNRPDSEPVPLFSGYPCERVDQRWHVRAP